MNSVQKCIYLVGSCDCLTKSPESKYHDKTCKYRIIHELIEENERLEKEIKKLKGPKYPCKHNVINYCGICEMSLDMSDKIG